MSLSSTTCGASGGQFAQFALMVLAQQPACKLRYAREQKCRRLAMRRMPHAPIERDLDRAVAFLPRHLDLALRAILIVLALHDQDRHADIGERLGDVPVAEFGIEPGVVPAAEGIVNVGVPARELLPQI